MSTLQLTSTGGDSIEITTEATHEELVDAVQLLATECAQLREDNAELREQVADLTDELDETRETLADTRKQLQNAEMDLESTQAQLDVVEDEQEDIREHQASVAKDLAETNQRVSKLEDTSDPSGEASNSSEQLSQTLRTPLEQVTAWADDVAEDELTANKLRAREVVKDIDQYTTKAPAGQVIKAGDLRKVLSAIEGTGTHSETLNRVIEFLDDFGKDEVDVIKRRGERRISFSDSLVERLTDAAPMSITSCVSPSPAGA